MITINSSGMCLRKRLDKGACDLSTRSQVVFTRESEERMSSARLIFDSDS